MLAKGNLLHLKDKLLKAEKPCFTMQYAAFQETG